MTKAPKLKAEATALELEDAWKAKRMMEASKLKAKAKPLELKDSSETEGMKEALADAAEKDVDEAR